ncbi:hypothetical protein [Nannocystis pusilla]|uniref:hypothetical protein n=1 Tax=Nannocystis pusilla TaxID=889268 RepID=UPI003B7DA27B
MHVACGPQPATTTDGATNDGTTTGLTTGAPVTTGSEPGTTATASTLGTTADDSTTGVTTTGVVFITPLDGGVACLTGCECDIWTQDCPDGEKCVPYSPTPEYVWQYVECVPLAPDPAHPGEPCTVEGNPFSGVDSCDLDSMCFHVDPDTLVGTCVRTCDGPWDAPECPAGDACHVSHDGNVALCLPKCDPLLADCPMGQVCIPTSHHEFACTPDLSRVEGQVFDPCFDEAGCDPGLVCVPADFAIECDPGQSARCCLPFCDLDQPPACPGAGQQCTQFNAYGPIGDEGPGVCALWR